MPFWDRAGTAEFIIINKKSAVGAYEMSNIKKKLKASRFSQAKILSVCVPNEERNA